MAFNLSILLVFSCLSLNLVLQTGVGVSAITVGLDNPLRRGLYQWFILFVVTILVWTIFTVVLYPLGLGGLKYFLLFPSAAVLTFAAEQIVPVTIYGSRQRAYQQALQRPPEFQADSAYSGLAVVSTLLTMIIASNFVEALILAAGFSSGVFLTIILTKAINERLSCEKAPALLRGMPLVLISMGLLSMIFIEVAEVLMNH
jgi:electron transport complex protein RnfA